MINILALFALYTYLVQNYYLLVLGVPDVRLHSQVSPSLVDLETKVHFAGVWVANFYVVMISSCSGFLRTWTSAAFKTCEELSVCVEWSLVSRSGSLT